MADDEHDEEEKLHNSAEKLSNIVEKLSNDDELTEAEKQLIMSTSVRAFAIKLRREAEKNAAERRDLERRKVKALELLLQQQREEPPAEPDNQLSFTKDELEQYVTHRKAGLAAKSIDGIDRESRVLWDCTKGEISDTSMTALSTVVLEKYSSIDSHRKVLGFAAAFLKYLANTRFDTSISLTVSFLEPPKTVRARKAITERTVTRVHCFII